MHKKSRARRAPSSLLVAALLAFALPLVACGPGGGGGGGVAVEDLGSSYADAACDLYERCDPILVDLFIGGRANCELTTVANFEDQQLELIQAAIAGGTVVYDGNQAATCLNALRRRRCGEDLSAPAACEGAFVGQIAEGQSCTITEECAGDATCENAGSCPGTCVARVAEGGDCSEGQACASGTRCDGATCVQATGSGGSCESDGECAGISVCLGGDPETGTPGTCATRESLYTSALGESCDVESSPCVLGLSCVVEAIGPMGPTYVCAEPVGAGEACTVGAPSQCPDSQYCDADIRAGMTTGTCVDRPTAGEACGAGAFGGVCATGLSCNEAEVCEAIARNGDPCGSDDQCASSYCAESGVCATPTCG